MLALRAVDTFAVNNSGVAHPVASHLSQRDNPAHVAYSCLRDEYGLFVLVIECSLQNLIEH